MPKIITHPDNLAALKREVDSGSHDTGRLFNSIEIQTNRHMDRDKPTGRFILPGGTVADRDAVRVEERFVEYGPEDIEFLLWAGIIREEREALFYQIDDSAFRMMFDFMPMTTQRYVMYSGF